MAVYLMPESLLYPIVAEMSDGTLKDIAQDIERNAKRHLAQDRATTEWGKLPVPMVKRQQASGLTDIGSTTEAAKYGNDYIIWLEGGEDNRAAMAIEMGHSPSGYFAGKSWTDSPRGLHILSRAAGLTMLYRFGR
jgi:hypothetical protein